MLRNNSLVFRLMGLTLLLSSLLAACGSDNSTPVPSGLEVVTAPTAAAETVTTAATSLATVTTGPASSVATTANATTVVATTSAATTTAASLTTAATATNTPIVATTAAATTVVAAKASPTVAVTQKPTTGDIKKGVMLEPMSWEAQTWNNCAPMSALMALSYYGVKLSQEECGKAIRPNSGDKHVQPQELINFIQKQGFKTMQRENGSLDKMQALLSAGIPVITQQWLHLNDDIGHYRVLRGYDTATNTLIFNDSMDRKPKTVVGTAEQETLWKGYDHRYFPVYTAKQEATVMAILGDDADAKNNQSRAIAAAQKYATSNPADIDAWRNLGYLNYQAGDCKAALNVWEQNLRPKLAASENGPYNRFLWYQLWPVECYNKLGNYAQVIKMAPNEIEKTKVYAEARYEYAIALSNTGRKDEAIAQLKKALLDDSNYQPTYDMLAKLGVS